MTMGWPYAPRAHAVIRHDGNSAPPAGHDGQSRLVRRPGRCANPAFREGYTPAPTAAEPSRRPTPTPTPAPSVAPAITGRGSPNATGASELRPTRVNGPTPGPHCATRVGSRRRSRARCAASRSPSNVDADPAALPSVSRAGPRPGRCVNASSVGSRGQSIPGCGWAIFAGRATPGCVTLPRPARTASRLGH